MKTTPFFNQARTKKPHFVLQTKKAITAAAGALKIEIILTETLVPFAQIISNIEDLGFINPILINAENGIIAGYGRVMAAEKMALAVVPYIRLGHLTEKKNGPTPYQ